MNVKAASATVTVMYQRRKPECWTSAAARIPSRLKAAKRPASDQSVLVVARRLRDIKAAATKERDISALAQRNEATTSAGRATRSNAASRYAASSAIPSTAKVTQ